MEAHIIEAMTDSSAAAEDFSEFANQFLNENTHLFTFLGVFGAIAVYLGTITTGLSTIYADIALDIGIFSSLSLFILVGVMIGRKYYREYSEFSDLPMFYPQKKNYITGLIPGLTLVFFTALIGAVSIVVIVTLWESWFRFFQIIVPLLLLYSLITINTYVPNAIKESDRLTWVAYLGVLFLLGLMAFSILSIIYISFFDVSDEGHQILTWGILIIGLILPFILFGLIPISYRNVD